MLTVSKTAGHTLWRSNLSNARGPMRSGKRESWHPQRLTGLEVLQQRRLHFRRASNPAWRACRQSLDKRVCNGVASSTYALVTHPCSDDAEIKALIFLLYLRAGKC